MRTLQEVRKNLYMAIEDDKDFFQTYQNLKVQEFEVAEDVWVPYHVVTANDRDIVKHIDLENVGTIHDVCGPVILVDEKNTRFQKPRSLYNKRSRAHHER